MSIDREVKPIVSVVIPFYSSSSSYLHAIFEQDTKYLYEVFICDDKSPMPPIIPKNTSRSLIYYEVISNSINKGPGAARNLAKDKCSGQYVVFLDSDVCVTHHFIEHMASEISRTNRLIAALEAPQQYPEYGNTLQKLIWFIPDMAGNTNRDDVSWASTTASIWKRNILDELGWFKEWRTGEDTDLSMRALKAGYRFAMAREHVLQHYRKTLFSFLRQQFNYGVGGARLIKETKQLPNKRKNYLLEYIKIAQDAKTIIGIKGYILILGLQPLKHLANLSGIIWGGLM